MNSSAHLTTNLVDNLNQKSLLGLATEGSRAGDSATGYTLPTGAELEGQFPELKIREMVGSGGMGCVFRAQQSRLERDVALKLLPRELGADGMFAERFSREARAMARLNHPNIVSIHDLGESNGLHYLIMEYMDGMNLRELLEAGPISPLDAIRIFESVCQALAYAHAEGVIHRDIKPENILFNKLGHVALADFGLARLATDSNAAVSLTQTRQAMGTLNYMAPEQWENPKAVDYRADVYSLGILLYELLTGRVPRGTFPPASSIADVPETVDAAINKALQIDAADRHHSVAEFCQAVMGESIPGSEGGEFDQNGTLTNFMNVGAGVLRAIPVPTVVNADRMHTHAVWTNLIAAGVVLMMSMQPWMYMMEGGYSRAFEGMMTYVLLDQVQIPISLIPVASGLIFLLALMRKKIHAVRADLISIVVGSAAIAVTAMSFELLHGLNRSGEQMRGQLTIFPFLVMGVLVFQLVETLIRIGYLAWVPFRRLYDWLRSYVVQETEKERKKKAEKSAKWQARWNSFLKGWHQLTGVQNSKDSDDS